MDTQKVQITDNYKKNQKDRFSAASKGPKGYVEIFEKKSGGLNKIGEEDITFPIHEGPNQIVYPGRVWLMQRAFNQELTVAGTEGRYISWFGLGTGGATAGDPLNPISPLITDTELDSVSIINSTDLVNCVDGGRLHKFDSIVYEIDTANNDQYLISKVTTTVGQEDANGAAGSTYYDLSEAGLYISDSNDTAEFNSSSKILFARVTFSTIRKHNLREIVFIWSIYF